MTLSTHVLDATGGKPARGLRVQWDTLRDGEWAAAGSGATDEDGRITEWTTSGTDLGIHRLVFGTGAAELLGSAVLIGTALHLMGQGWAGAIGLGLALTLSSTALVLPLVGTTSPVGRGAFAMLLFEDLALVPIIFALGAMAPTASDEGWVGIAGVALRGGLTVVAMYLGGKFVLPRLFAQAARTKSPELFLAASLLVVIVASVATTAAGLSPIVGALLAGLLIAETEYHSEVEVMTAPFKGLALGVFLITVGMSLDLRLIAKNWDMLLLAVVGVVAVKAIVTYLLLRLAHARRGVAAETGLLMGSPSETTLIVLGTAAQAQLILPSTAAFWQTVTAIGLTITPLLAKAGRTARRPGCKFESGQEVSDNENAYPRSRGNGGLAASRRAGRSAPGSDRDRRRAGRSHDRRFFGRRQSRLCRQHRGRQLRNGRLYLFDRDERHLQRPQLHAGRSHLFRRERADVHRGQLR